MATTVCIIFSHGVVFSVSCNKVMAGKLVAPRLVKGFRSFPTINRNENLRSNRRVIRNENLAPEETQEHQCERELL